MRVTISGNVVTNTFNPVAVGASADNTGTYVWGPKNIAVVGNVLTTPTSAEGSLGTGIIFQGVVTDPATGTIVGNMVRGQGAQSVAASMPYSGCIGVYKTAGVTISGNTLKNCAPVGILTVGDNAATTISGNTIIDPWTDDAGVGEADGIKEYGAGTDSLLIGDNRIVAVSTSHTYRLNTATGKAIVIANTAGNTAQLGVNMTNATTALSDPSGLATGISAATLNGATFASPGNIGTGTPGTVNSTMYNMAQAASSTYVAEQYGNTQPGGCWQSACKSCRE